MAMFSLKNRRITFRATVLSLFFLVTLILSSIFILQLAYFGNRQSHHSVNAKVTHLTEAIKNTIQNHQKKSKNIVKAASFIDSDRKDLYTALLSNNPELYAIYSGFSDGGFYEIINLNIDDSLKKRYGANADDRWALIEIENGKNQEKITLLNKNLQTTATTIKESSYDPRTRPWYIAAKNSLDVIKTEPYLFANIPQKGITYAGKLKDEEGIVAVDNLLHSMNIFFKQMITNDYTYTYIFDKNKELVSAFKNRALAEDFFNQGYKLEDFRSPDIVTVNTTEYLVQIQEIETEPKEYLLFMTDYDKTISPYKRNISKMILVSVVIILLLLPIIFYLAKIIIRPIYKLKDQSKQIQQREFDKVDTVNTPVLEIAQLSDAMFYMAQAIHQYQSGLEEKVKQRTKELDEKNKELLQLSITDKLTGLYNRVKLDESMSEHYQVSKRYKTEFSLLLIDIDYFKKINDTFGHKIGDEVLVELAQVLQNSVRKVDIVGRWGGEEFMIIAPQTDETQAFQLAQKINKEIATHRFQKYEKQVTVSIGVCSYSQYLNEQEMIINADKALYKAKRGGRNRVETH